MSRIQAQPPPPTTIHTSRALAPADTHDLLSAYLTSKSASQPWSHSHDAGTTASLRKLELSLRGIHGPAAATYLSSHFADESYPDDDGVSRVDTDEGDESERQRVYDTVQALEADEDREEASDDGLKELQDVKRDSVEDGDGDGNNENAGQTSVERPVVDKEERKRLKKLRNKEEKRRKEADRRADAE